MPDPASDGRSSAVVYVFPTTYSRGDGNERRGRRQRGRTFAWDFSARRGRFRRGMGVFGEEWEFSARHPSRAARSAFELSRTRFLAAREPRREKLPRTAPDSSGHVRPSGGPAEKHIKLPHEEIMCHICSPRTLNSGRAGPPSHGVLYPPATAHDAGNYADAVDAPFAEVANAAGNRPEYRCHPGMSLGKEPPPPAPDRSIRPPLPLVPFLVGARTFSNRSRTEGPCARRGCIERNGKKLAF